MKLKTTMLCFSILLSTIFLNQAFGQNITATGNVINKTTGNPVVGASVNLNGTTTSTSTDASGNFTISVPKGGKLNITSIGYSPTSIQINKEGAVTVLLEESSKNMDEVVVIGYGTRKITKVSGAISTVKSADIQRLSPVRIEQALQGSASGVSVIQNGTPGSKPTLFIRGIPGLGADPAVIVDGIPQTINDLNSINPSDIESVNVLKDAASTSIYGVKGGNGVIVITTKSGRKNQATEFVFNSSYGIQQVIRKMPLLNAAEYGAMLNEGSTLSGGNVIFPNLSTLGKGTDWQDEVFRNAPEQNYNISARGGTDKLSYFLAGGYLSQAGIVGGYDKSRFDRMNFTTNVSYSLTKKLKFLLNASYQNLSTKGVPSDAFNGVLGNALNFDPTVSKYNTVPNTIGEFGFSNLITQEIQNPLTQLSNTYNENKGNKLYGKFEFQYDVLKNLKFTTRFGYTKYDANAKTFNPLQFLGPNNIDPNNTLNADGTVKPNRHNSVSHDNFKNLNYTYEAFANYDFKLFKNHHFETVAGIALSKVSGNQQGVSRDDVPFNSWDYADYTAATGVNSILIVNGQPQVYTAIRGYYFQYFNKNASGFLRINYDYNDKYLVSLTGRRDGSTRFGADRRFGNFYAGSLGWVASKENFFKSNFINYLKIRGSYGVTGNDQAVPTNFAALSTIQTDYLASLYGTGNTIGYTFGNVFANGATLGTYANPLLGWESNTQANAGFEMNFHKNKFNVSADYYYKKTKDLLFTTNLSGYLGSIPSPVTNIGTTNTSGIDLSIGYNETIGRDLKLNTTLTFTTVRGEVTSTGASGAIPGGNFFNGQSQNTTLFAPGYAPGVYFGYRTDGLFQTQAEIDAITYLDGNGNTRKTYPNAAPGDIRFKDLNGDNILDS
ncbi:MAG: SusC/RagA family TonB-linked outer membrane protein, partial [Ferruginibacter sp.]